MGRGGVKNWPQQERGGGVGRILGRRNGEGDEGLRDQGLGTRDQWLGTGIARVGDWTVVIGASHLRLLLLSALARNNLQTVCK